MGTPVHEANPNSKSTTEVSRAGVVYEFESFRLDPANRLLTSEGREVLLPGRAFDVLLRLVEHPGALLTKDDLLESVWGGSMVEESNLTVAISTVRRALNEDPHERRLIQTVARRGYRFVAEVREGQEAPRAVRPATVAAAAAVSEPAMVTEPPVPAVEASAGGWWRMRFWPMLLVGFLLAALAAGFWFFLRPGEPIRTLAVLPVSSGNGAGVGEVELLGLTDGLVSRLSGELVVRPTSSVLKYSGLNEVDAVAAGREQGVDAVLAGELDGRTLRLRLVRVRDGLTLWKDSFKAGGGGLAGVQREAGNAAAQELQRLGAVTPAPSAANAAAQRVNDPAYQLYVRGRYFWNRRTEDGLRKAADYFRQSIAADPNYAPAYAGLADSYALLASFSVEPGRTANADARSAALSAIQLDPTLAEPHASLGMIEFFTDWNLPGAELEFERALRLNPNYATGHHWYALDLAAMGRFPQALYEIHEAQKLDPLSLIIGTNVGWVEYLARDYAGARRDLERVLELDPNFTRARTRLGMVELATGDYKAAVADLKQAVALSGDEDPWVEGLLGDAEARAGDRSDAEKLLAELRSRSATAYVPPISRALVLIGLGRKQEALTALAASVEDHSTAMVYARVDPALDDVRKEPGFGALEERILLK
jgi:DNA-binding winged helix-turn-helix (wHTH) protein/tetratricopeptide (TPR) repeat protein